MKELFEPQLDGNVPMTQETLTLLSEKTYFNGDEIKIGDKILFAMLVGDVIEKEGGVPEIPMELIKLNERHFDIFEYDPVYTGSEIPRIMIKERGIKITTK